MRIKTFMLTDGQDKVYCDEEGRLFIFASAEAANESGIPARLKSVDARCTTRECLMVLGKEGRTMIQQDRHCKLPWVSQARVTTEVIYSLEQEGKADAVEDVSDSDGSYTEGQSGHEKTQAD